MNTIELPKTIEDFRIFFEKHGFKPAEKSMSNFDHVIDEGMEEELKESPKLGNYAGWNFHGDVFYWNNQFHCIVMVYHSLREVISANTLSEIMEEVSEKYGYE